MIPLTRKENYLNEIVGWGNTAPEKPTTPEEFFFAAILGEAVQVPDLSNASRYELFLAKIAGYNVNISPPTYTSPRLEFFLAKAAGMDVVTPVPLTKEEIFWANYKGREQIIEGVPPLMFKSNGANLSNYLIYGNTVNGESVGNLVESGEHTGEYLVPLTVTNGTDIKSTNIYLPEQLEKCGKEVDFINYETQTLQKRKVIYGWHVDPSISDSSDSITYLEDAIGLTPAAMGTTSFNYGSWENAFFMPKPCMLKSNGIVDYYLDPNDYSKKLDGTPSDISNSNYDGNAMMEWPKIWYKFVGGEVEGEGSFFVSSYKVDDTYHCWCNIDSQNNKTEHFYTAIYNGTGTTKLRSISGITLTNANGNGGTNATQEVTRAIANNTTSDVEWYTDTYCDRILINALLVLMGKSLNTQAVYGRGIIRGGQEAKGAYTTGTLNDKGLFWGAISNDNSAVKVFGMENWWGCAWRRTAGCILVNGTMKIKLTYGTADGSSVTGYNTSGNGYINSGTLPSANGYIRKMQYNEFGYIPCDVTEGSSSTYYADYHYINTSGTMYSLFGGRADDDLSAGALCVHLSNGSVSSFWTIAAALSCKPLAGKNPETNLKNISLPTLPTLKGTNTLSFETTVQPSKVMIKTGKFGTHKVRYYDSDGTFLSAEDVKDGTNAQGFTPTKTSTVQYNYTFMGWSTTKGSTTAETGVLNDITADKSLYAVFSQSLRTFTVYFYNGSTLLQTAENVQYGGTATYTGETPTKDGFTFSGWQPSNVNITADTSCYAQFTEG